MTDDEKTLRDVFAGLALTGLLTRAGTSENTPAWAAELSYAIADAMLEARGA